MHSDILISLFLSKPYKGVRATKIQVAFSILLIYLLYSEEVLSGIARLERHDH